MKPKIHSPVDNIEQWAILDYTGCVRHAHGAGTDVDAVYGSVTGREINTAEHTFRAFLDMYFVPILEAGFAPRQILVAHDAGHEYRSSVLPEYKAKRDKKKGDDTKTDPEIKEQVDKASKMIKAFLANMGCTQAQVKGVEADDLIGYFNELPGRKQIFTVDADMLVLADEQTMIMMKGAPVLLGNLDTDALPKNMIGFYTPFLEDGEFPDWNIFTLLTLYKSIVGDSADEYKGIPQLGDKAWADIVAEFEKEGLESLAEIVDTKNWRELEGYVTTYQEEPSLVGGIGHKMLGKLFEHRNAWRTCWIVAELHPELCWKPRNKKMTEIEWYKRIPNKAKILQILEATNTREFLEDIEPYLPMEWLIDADNFHPDDLAEFTEACRASPHVSYDYEGWAERNENFEKAAASGSDYVDMLGQKITGCSFNFGNNLQYSFYITIDHADSKNLPMSVLQQFLEAIPADTVKVAQNSVFEEAVTLVNMNGFKLPIGTVHDTAIMSVYRDENRVTHGLKALSLDLLQYTQASYKETLANAGVENMQQISADQVLRYGLDDSIVTGSLYDLIKLDLLLQNVWEFYRDNEPYVNHRLACTYVSGVDIDYEVLKSLRKEDDSDIESGMLRLREILEEKCSKVNRAGALAYFNEEKSWLEASNRKRYGTMERDKFLEKMDSIATEIEALDIADDTYMEIAQRIRLKIPTATTKKAIEERDLSGVEQKSLIAWGIKFELHKSLNKGISESVYAKYESKVLNHVMAPTPANIDKVAAAVGLPCPGTAAKGKLVAWEADIRQIDFDTETDKFDELEDLQKTFINLIREAKEHFKPELRGNEHFIKFNDFCCEVLGLEGKVVTTGTELNLGSPVQMKSILYCMLGLPVRLRGKTNASRRDLGFWTGSPSTDVLARDTALAEDIQADPDKQWMAEVVTLIKQVTECQTRISLYHNGYPLFKHPMDGRMHPSIKNCGTVTKRPSGKEPNILQVSKHQKKGVMRGVYIPPRGYAVVPVDFAGQELRIQASETRDRNLLSVYLGAMADDYLSGKVPHVTYDMVKDRTDLKDLHGLTAFGITKHFGLDEAGDLIAGGQPAVKWSPETYEEYMEAFGDKDNEHHSLAGKVRKRPAKQTNFLLSYGGTAVTLSHRLIVPMSTATGIMDSTLTLYSGIVEAQEATLSFAKQHGYVLTAYGTRRHATEDVFSKTKGKVNRQVRQLYNARIQGCAADILKVVIADCEKADIWDRFSAIMVAPVYDELVAFVPYEHCWDYVQELRGFMNITPPGHGVPMVADISVGPNWQIQHELGHQPTKEAFEAVLYEKVVPVVEATWDRIEGVV